ncbi:MAG: glycoside hydrolase family 92 protein [Balneolaceae bacterium]|nr:MAG: glycoside hydrolase family 92 protein [Balneolaceae bacterium]
MNFVRSFKFPILSSLLILMGFSACSEQSGEIRPQVTPVDMVYPLIDTAHSRWFFFSSASRPFGMVNLSPDMEIDGAWETGYKYNSDRIKVFSHIHAWQLSGIPILPTTGEFQGHLGPDVYGSHYNREQEIVFPGYHRVVLDDYDITAELTSTTRAGFHRYTWPESPQSHILFDFTTTLGPSATSEGSVEKVSDTELQGFGVMAGTIRRPKPVTVYFVAQFDRPFDSFSGWKDGELVEVGDRIEGEKTGAYVTYSTKEGDVTQMKVGISYVSTEQARLNLETEMPHWDFDRVVEESRQEWNEWLGRIEIEGGTEIQQRRFYTDLWKALQGRRIVSDVNGRYLDMTGVAPRTGQIPLDEQGRPLFNHHNSDSFWGAQWSLNTLWHLVYPEVTESFVNSMLLMYEDGGLIPRGPSGGNYTYVMTGASTTPFIVSAWLKGIRGFDIEKAYEGLRKNHFPGGMMSKAGYEHDTTTGGGIEYYIDRGYIPFPLYDRNYGFHQAGAGQTLEYAYQDWALSQLALALGNEEDAGLFSERAGNYRNLWNAEKGWMWPRDRDGNWRDTEGYDHLTYAGPWVESNAAQYTWWVPHDLKGLADLMGGAEAFTEKLNTSFENAQHHLFTSGIAHAMETIRDYRRVYINYGNQQSMQTAWLFNYSGAPWLTQYWTRRVVEEVYSHLTYDRGYSGDEDQGLMGSLAVLLKIGLFSTDGGVYQEPFYEIGSPIFDQITIHLNPDYYPGGTFVIRTDNNGPENYYIRSASLNGEELDRPWIPHTMLINGGELHLNMGPKPNKEWGSRPDQAPPSRTK